MLLTPASNNTIIIIMRLLLSAHICFVGLQSALLSFFKNFFFIFFF